MQRELRQVRLHPAVQFSPLLRVHLQRPRVYKIHGSQLLAARKRIIRTILQPGNARRRPKDLLKSGKPRAGARHSPLGEIPARQHRPHLRTNSFEVHCSLAGAEHFVMAEMHITSPSVFALTHVSPQTNLTQKHSLVTKASPVRLSSTEIIESGLPEVYLRFV